MAGGGGFLLYLQMHDNPTDLRAVLRDYGEEMVLPALEVYTEGLMTDSTMYDAFLARAKKASRSAHQEGENMTMTATSLQRANTTDGRARCRNPGSVQVFRPHQGARRPRPDRRPGRHHRLPRAERRGQVHHHPGAARSAARRRRHRPAARRRSLARRGRAAPADRLRARRCDVVAQPDRPAGHRLSGPPARQRQSTPDAATS